jgi:hypothetical protein
VDQLTDIAKVIGTFLQLSIAKTLKEVKKIFLESS